MGRASRERRWRRQGRAGGRERLPVPRLSRCLVLVAAGFLAVAVTASGQLSGRFGLDFVALRIPTTLTDEIALDTPSEFAMLEFGISSDLAVTADVGFAELKLDAATNMAGAEHAVGIADVELAPISLSGVRIEDIHMIGELWCAVPFEGVTDVNNLPNCVVIPPGDPLFVAARVTTSFECAGFAAKWLVMLEDVRFPQPSASYTPLYYGVPDQDFGLGNILSASWTSSCGVAFHATLGFNASQAPTVVKGYSASGRVDSGECDTGLCNYFLNGSVGGIPLCDLCLGILALTDVRMSVAFSASTTQTLSATAGFSAKLNGDMNVSTSVMLFKKPFTAPGLNVTASLGCFDFGMSLDKLALTSLSASCGGTLNLGALTGSYGLSATGLERGMTGLSARLAVSQGLFSASTSAAFAQRGADFGFASLATQFAFRFSPGTISIQATFSRNGLTRASIGAGVTF